MFARRLLVIATLLSSALVAACGSLPTGVDTSASTMQDSLSVRKDQTPWH